MNWSASDELLSLTHLDGRNAGKLVSLRPYFSEFAWMKRRLAVMCGYLLAIQARLRPQLLSSRQKKQILTISDEFNLHEARWIRRQERVFNHDLKAIEIFLVKRLTQLKGADLLCLVNFGLGSEDINNVALALSLRESREEVIIPALQSLASQLVAGVRRYRRLTMVARTHAQPAGVTTLGKELANTLFRLCDVTQELSAIVFTAKLSGETGTWQALDAAYPEVNWLKFSDDFLGSLGLEPNHATTQIVPYDRLVTYLQALGRLNSVLIDFSRHIWLWVLLGLLTVKKIETEVGSAGMPHKVNPIYFEGAEGGLLVANGLIEALARQLPLNRLQRDFSDSTIRRNLSLPLAYSLLSYQSLVEGLKRLEPDSLAIRRDLASHYEVWVESLKTLGQAQGWPNFYDKLKKETRGKVLSDQDFRALITKMNLPVKTKQRIESLITHSAINPYPELVVAEAIKKAQRVFKL